MVKFSLSSADKDAIRASALLRKRRPSGRCPIFRWPVVPLSIRCASCGQDWPATLPFSVYERQALESCPCPHCGSYTLCCAEPVGVGRESEPRAWTEAEF